MRVRFWWCFGCCYGESLGLVFASKFAGPCALEACVITSSLIEKRSFFSLVGTILGRIAPFARCRGDLFEPMARFFRFVGRSGMLQKTMIFWQRTKTSKIRG